MRAQEYFEQVREAVLEIERSKEMLARMLASEGAKIQRYGEQQGNGNSDAMDRVNREPWACSNHLFSLVKDFKEDLEALGVEIDAV